MIVETSDISLPKVDTDVEHHDGMDEERLIKKVDYHLVPILCFLCFLSRLNTMNIANARLGGLETDLNLSPEEFQICLSIFFVGLIIFQIPSSIMLRRLQPSRWIPLIVFLWGVVSVLSAAATGFYTFLLSRFLLGSLQCGFFPSLNYYVSLWYLKKQQAVRFGSIWAFSALSGAFGGFAAYGISMIQTSYFSQWQLIFIVEGIPIIVLAIFCWYYLPNSPEDAWFLNEKERKFLVYCLARDSGSFRNNSFSWEQVVSVFTDWKAHIYAIIRITGQIPFQCITLFLPTIIHAMGHWTEVETQLLTVPPYLLAFLATILISKSSDGLVERSYHILATNLMCVAGLLILMFVDLQNMDVLYIGVILFMCGSYSGVSIRTAWVNNNFASLTRKAIVIGYMGAVTSISGLISGPIYHDNQKPRFFLGNSISLLCFLIQSIVIICLRFMLAFINRRRSRMNEKEIIEQIEFYGGHDLVGDRHPRFRYTL